MQNANMETVKTQTRTQTQTDTQTRTQTQTETYTWRRHYMKKKGIKLYPSLTNDEFRALIEEESFNYFLRLRSFAQNLTRSAHIVI